MGAAVFHSTYSEHGEEEHNSLRAKRLFQGSAHPLSAFGTCNVLCRQKKGKKDESPK